MFKPGRLGVTLVSWVFGDFPLCCVKRKKRRPLTSGSQSVVLGSAAVASSENLMKCKYWSSSLFDSKRRETGA